MPQNFAQYFRSLQILFFALLAGQILVTITLFTVYEPSTSGEFSDEETLRFIFPLLVIMLAGLAFFLYRKKLESARAQPTLKEKLMDYRVAGVLKWAPIESATLISVVLFFISGKQYYLYAAIAIIAIFATQFPSRQRLVNELDLSASEQMTLDDPNAEVAESRNYRNYTN